MEVAILHALILTVTGTDQQMAGSLTASAPRIAKPTSAATRSYATAAAVQWVARVLIPIRSTGGILTKEQKSCFKLPHVFINSYKQEKKLTINMGDSIFQIYVCVHVYSLVPRLIWYQSHEEYL